MGQVAGPHGRAVFADPEVDLDIDLLAFMWAATGASS